MLSIGVMGAGSGDYYAFLAQEDYYLNGGEPLGQWWGQGAAHLGLTGKVTTKHLGLLLDGYSSKGKPLVKNAGSESRRPGFDFTFSAPKSVSALWAICSDGVRAEIQAAHDAAVIAALNYIQREAAISRTGKEGINVHDAKLIVALFGHCTSRALDPQLHTHALFMNLGILADDRTNALFHPSLFRHKMAAGAIYRAELAAQLQRRLGLLLERVGFAFEIVGVAKELIKMWSTRRGQIEEQLGRWGIDSAAAAAQACLESREPKTVVPPRIELFARWQEEAATLGFTREMADSLVKPTLLQGFPVAENTIIDLALNKLTADVSHFTKRDFVRHAAEEAQTLGLDARMVLEAVDAAMKKHARLVVQGPDRLTTKDILRLERKLIRVAKLVHRRQGHGVDEAVIEKALKNFQPPGKVVVQNGRTIADGLSDPRASLNARSQAEQLKAVRYLTEKGGGLRIFEGTAGSGKTSTLGMARAVWEQGGYQVLGAAVANKAARELQNRAGIKSMSVAKLLHMLDDSYAKEWKHHGRMIVREALKKPTFKFQPLKLTERTVLVVDEASMLDTRMFAKLMEHVQRGKAMIVPVGDRDQLQSIGAGGAFPHLADTLGKASLTVNMRQRNPADRELVENVTQGNVADALRNLAKRERLVLAPGRDAAMAKLIDDWYTRERYQFHESLIYAPTRNAVDALNVGCQAKRLMEGNLQSSTGVAAKFVDPQSKIATTVALFKGDRVMLHKNNRTLDVDNGDMGTIVKIKKTLRSPILTIDLDRGQRAIIPLRDYPHIAPGYATTVHKGQGSTIERGYIFAVGGTQDIQMTLVQFTRAKHELRVYASEHDAGEDLRGLAARMQREGEKTLATEIPNRQETFRQEQPVQEKQELNGYSRRR